MNSSSSTTAMPAASVDLMTAGMLRSSLMRIGLPPRPNSMARAIAAAPGGPSVSPAGRPGGVPAPVTTNTLSPGLIDFLQELGGEPGQRLLLLLARRLVERIGHAARQADAKPHLDVDGAVDRIADDFVDSH